MSDYSSIAALQKQLLDAAAELDRLAPEVAKARTIRTYDSDRRKGLLSKIVAPLLVNESASSAEHMARATDEYAKGMKELRTDYLSAESAIAQYDAAQCRFDALRSLLSAMKAEISNV